MDRQNQRYGRKQIARVRDIPLSLIQRLSQAGLIQPTRGKRNEFHFSFQELLLLRTARALLHAKVPARRMMAALAELKAVQGARPLTGLSLFAAGNEVAVQQGNTRWAAGSGQLLLDFEEPLAPGSVHGFPPQRDEPSPTADEWFQRGCAQEPEDAAAAEQAYRCALSVDAGHMNACLNLGALLCEARRWDEAAEHYRQALRGCGDQPALHFNLGVVLEMLGDDGQALKAYRRCLEFDPTFADAHYNLSQLLERRGDVQGAFRHLSAYRRATRRPSP